MYDAVMVLRLSYGRRQETATRLHRQAVVDQAGHARSGYVITVVTIHLCNQVFTHLTASDIYFVCSSLALLQTRPTLLSFYTVVSRYVYERE